MRLQLKGSNEKENIDLENLLPETTMIERKVAFHFHTKWLGHII